MFELKLDGAHPRYDGTASAHVSTQCGRYDYAFDCHDRLTSAAYTQGANAADGEDFSAEYAYACGGELLSVKRYAQPSIYGGQTHFKLNFDRGNIELS